MRTNRQCVAVWLLSSAAILAAVFYVIPPPPVERVARVITAAAIEAVRGGR